MTRSETVQRLRAEIRRFGSALPPQRELLPFGVDIVDENLGGGLVHGALHEITGGAGDVVHGAAATLFTAGIAARTRGPVLWCITRPDLFSPALAQAGLDPDRLIIVEAGDEPSLLSCCEEALRHGGLGAVVGELAKLSMTASRRLTLASETSGVMALVVRRWRRDRDALSFAHPTAATTRWRVSAVPSTALPVPGVGRARWRVELVRSRTGQCAEFVLEACDEEGRLACPSDLANGPLLSPSGALRAAS